jgi:hypothetical protein
LKPKALLLHAGLYDLKPFVHSDCGGDIGNNVRGTAGNLIRWTAHCSYGSILRFHGGDHRAWNYDNSTVGTIRQYLHARYRLIPSFIAAGQKVSKLPCVRCTFLAEYVWFIKTGSGTRLKPKSNKYPKRGWRVVSHMQASRTGMPYVARCDLFWPEHRCGN